MTGTICIPPGYQPQSLDTSIEIERVQFSLLRALPLPQRAARMAQWTKGCWQLNLSGIQQRHPNASPIQIRCQFAKVVAAEALSDALLWQIRQHNTPLMLSDPISLALDIAQILNRLEIPYLIGGSVASALLGESRATEDIDLVADLSLEQVPSLIQALVPRFYLSEETVREAVRDRRSFNLIDHQSLGKIDIFVLKADPFPQSEFRRRRSQVVREPDETLVLPTPEDIILQKLRWYRLTRNRSDKQWRDILGVMKLQGETLDFDYLWQWAESLQLTESLAKALTAAGLF